MIVAPGSRLPWFPLPAAWRAFAIDTPGTVLLETAGGLGTDHVSYLFHAPARLLEATSTGELQALFEALEAATGSGFYAAGSVDYEAAYPLHNLPSAPSQAAIARFGVYEEPLRFDHHSGMVTGPVLPSGETTPPLLTTALISTPRLECEPDAFAVQVADIHRLLAAGDTYQVNLTTRVTAGLLAPPLALYEALIEAQPVDFAAVLHMMGDTLTLSLSPELFFRIDRSEYISTRPMKGTAPRGSDPAADEVQRTWLAQDIKNRAEHVMIVDLLRNDLGRICTAGSVRTDDLFRVEPYPTLFQMTSCVSGRLSRGTRLAAIFGALFPSGSITGAPKRRTMEIIRDIEASPRGVYTGAIGFLAPNGDACFSVPIRTLDIHGSQLSMGVGGGIVADSTAQAEYDECILKAAFLNSAAKPIQLIETLLWNNGYPRLEAHLARLEASAHSLGFHCDPAKVRASLTEAAGSLQVETRVRLLLCAGGTCTIATSVLAGPRANLRVRVSSRRLCSSDQWLRHKTTHRPLYDRELARAKADGFDEVLFLNERDELAEGAISTLFLDRDGNRYTPPLTAGVLPGVLRDEQLTVGALERTLRLKDLQQADAIYLGNAVRGLRSVGSLEIE